MTLVFAFLKNYILVLHNSKLKRNKQWQWAMWSGVTCLMWTAGCWFPLMCVCQSVHADFFLKHGLPLESGCISLKMTSRLSHWNKKKTLINTEAKHNNMQLNKKRYILVGFTHVVASPPGWPRIWGRNITVAYATVTAGCQSVQLLFDLAAFIKPFILPFHLGGERLMGSLRCSAASPAFRRGFCMLTCLAEKSLFIRCCSLWRRCAAREPVFTAPAAAQSLSAKRSVLGRVSWVGK